MSPLERLVLIQDQEIKLAKSAKLEFFLDLPDQWYDPEPVYGCENAHISKRYLKSEKKWCSLPRVPRATGDVATTLY